MMQLNTSDVSVFNKVAQTLSFTTAARAIGTSRSAISKRISRLEKHLGVILLNRSTRSVSLTEAGRTLLRHTSEVDAMIERAVDDIRAADMEPIGAVKLCMPSSLSTMLMPSLINQFQELWPNVQINIDVEERVVDLIAGGYDLAIRVSPKLGDSCLISRRLCSTSKVLAASPDYLEEFGVPQSLQDLNDHRCLGLSSASSQIANWSFNSGEKVIEIPCTFPVTSNNAQALIDAACRDGGVIYVPQAYINSELAEKRLEHILPDSHDPMSYGIFAVYPHRNAAAKVKVLVDFIDNQLNSESWA